MSLPDNMPYKDLLESASITLEEITGNLAVKGTTPYTIKITPDEAVMEKIIAALKYSPSKLMMLTGWCAAEDIKKVYQSEK